MKSLICSRGSGDVVVDGWEWEKERSGRRVGAGGTL